MPLGCLSLVLFIPVSCHPPPRPLPPDEVRGGSGRSQGGGRHDGGERGPTSVGAETSETSSATHAWRRRPVYEKTDSGSSITSGRVESPPPIRHVPVSFGAKVGLWSNSGRKPRCHGSPLSFSTASTAPPFPVRTLNSKDLSVPSAEKEGPRHTVGGRVVLEGP